MLSIDRESSLVHCDDGQSIAYAYLVCATGSRAFLPPIEGADLPGVFSYRSLVDIAAIKAAVSVQKKVAIIGGGLLGLELAKSLTDLGAQVHVLERGPGLMIKQLNPVASEILRKEISGLGITVMLQTAESIAFDQGGLCLKLGPEEHLHVDFVVAVAGIRARDEIARDAGLRCSATQRNRD